MEAPFGTENLDLDLKGRLQSYLPVLFDFLSVRDFDSAQWLKLESNFKQRYLQRKADFEANNNYLLVKRNFFDLITGKLRDERAAVIFFDLVKKLLEELADRFTGEEKKQVIPTLYNLMIADDEKFLNFLGELLVLNAVTKGGNFRLIEVESTIVGDLSADFLFERTSDGGKELIEVTNIHIDEKNTRLDERLSSQYARKFQKKTRGAAIFNKFLLVPVIWAPYTDLRRILDLYQGGTMAQNPEVLEPVAYIALTMPDGGIVYQFGSLSTLLRQPA
ncbi:hypothetical protein [Mucilaginibacter sp. AK015]|uniref:hypothetical protein n=1 Tax=Mucilaginibacter sp. AK015 TaxID=2723072 RepID=UPI00160CF618|nr:hypothetical protein [Mucilaginibacter sp. AK015]MBB5396686.1 hypothetical protein [Mucilaginibacter sp. AK015]